MQNLRSATDESTIPEMQSASVTCKMLNTSQQYRHTNQPQISHHFLASHPYSSHGPVAAKVVYLLVYY